MTATNSAEIPALPPAAREDEMFPVLTPEQLERLAAQGQRRRVAAGDVLHEGSEHVSRFFALVSGRIDILAGEDFGERVVSLSRPGQFTGELNVLSGRRGFVRVRAITDVEVAEVDREHLLSIVQTDDELSGILMRAFILRRVELIARGLRRRGPDWIHALGRHAARPGVPDPQRPSLHLRRSRTLAGRAVAARSLPRHRRGHPGADLPERRRAEEPDQRRCCRLPRVQRINRSGPGPRPGDRRSRAVRAGCRGLRRLRRPRSLGRRGHLTGRPGRLELEDRKLPGLPRGRVGAGARRPRLRASAEIRGRGADRERGDAALVQPEAVCDRPRRRGPGAGPLGHHRDRRRIPEARGRESRGIRRGRRLLRRDLRRVATVQGRGRDRRRRRQLRRPGSRLPVAHRAARVRAGAIRAGWPTACRGT